MYHYHPEDLARLLKILLHRSLEYPDQPESWMLEGAAERDIVPWYLNFDGIIEGHPHGEWYEMRGILEDHGDHVDILELPVAPKLLFIDDYRQFLEGLEEDNQGQQGRKKKGKEIHPRFPLGIIKVTNTSTSNSPRFRVWWTQQQRDACLLACGNDLYKAFGLRTALKDNNIHFVDDGRVPRRFLCVAHVLDTFFAGILPYYEKVWVQRCSFVALFLSHFFLSQLWRNDIAVLESKLGDARLRWQFTDAVCSETLSVSRRPKEDILRDMVSLGLGQEPRQLAFLLDIPLVSLTEKRMRQLEDTITRLETELYELQHHKKPQHLWMEDLDHFLDVWRPWAQEQEADHREQAEIALRKLRDTRCPPRFERWWEGMGNVLPCNPVPPPAPVKQKGTKRAAAKDRPPQKDGAPPLK